MKGIARVRLSTRFWPPSAPLDMSSERKERQVHTLRFRVPNNGALAVPHQVLPAGVHRLLQLPHGQRMVTWAGSGVRSDQVRRAQPQRHAPASGISTYAPQKSNRDIKRLLTLFTGGVAQLPEAVAACGRHVLCAQSHQSTPRLLGVHPGHHRAQQRNKTARRQQPTVRLLLSELPSTP